MRLAVSNQLSAVSYRLSGTIMESRDERMRPREIIFEVTESLDGGFEARALGFSIFTEADSWNELKA